MSSIAVYPGTFDPITLGHVDIARRAARCFDHVIVAVAESPHKKTLLSVAQRVACAEMSLADISNVTVVCFSNLLVDLARAHNARVIIRGVRSAADVDHELQLAAMNRNLAEEIETIFFTPQARYSHLSSTLVRDVARLGGDVTPFVHPDVAECLATQKQ